MASNTASGSASRVTSPVRHSISRPRALALFASEADHLGREIDPGHARAALGERDGPLTTAAAGVEEARIPAQPKGIPDAIELGIAVGRQGIDLGPGVPTLGASVPGGA